MINNQPDTTQEFANQKETDDLNGGSGIQPPRLPIQQNVPQSGKFNTAISEGTNVQIGDTYHGVTTKDFRVMIETLQSAGILPVVEHTEQPLGDVPLCTLAFNTQLAEKINARLTTLEELSRAEQLSAEQQAEFNQVKDKVRSMMDMQGILGDLELKAKTLLDMAVESLANKLNELKGKQSNQLKAGIEEADISGCLQEQIDLLKQFRGDLERSQLLANWLDRERTNELAKKLVDYAVEKHLGVNHTLSAQKMKALYFSVDRILAALSTCLSWGRRNLLDNNKSVTRVIVDDEIYIIVFEHLGSIVPKRYYPDAFAQLQEYCGYLVQRLPNYRILNVD